MTKLFKISNNNNNNFNNFPLTTESFMSKKISYLSIWNHSLNTKFSHTKKKVATLNFKYAHTKIYEVNEK